jgi:aconitate hydratase
MLALTFKNPTDYDLIREDDNAAIRGLAKFAPGLPLMLELKHSDNTVDSIELNHTFNEGQIAWFKAGSALNLIAAQMKKPAKKKTAKKKNVKKAVKKVAGKKAKAKPVKKKSRRQNSQKKAGKKKVNRSK